MIKRLIGKGLCVLLVLVFLLTGCAVGYCEEDIIEFDALFMNVINADCGGMLWWKLASSQSDNRAKCTVLLATDLFVLNSDLFATKDYASECFTSFVTQSTYFGIMKDMNFIVIHGHGIDNDFEIMYDPDTGKSYFFAVPAMKDEGIEEFLNEATDGKVYLNDPIYIAIAMIELNEAIGN